MRIMNVKQGTQDKSLWIRGSGSGKGDKSHEIRYAVKCERDKGGRIRHVR
jgi:hypothetical protein